MQVHISPLSDSTYISPSAPKLLYVTKITEGDHLYGRGPHSHPNLVEWIYVLSGSAEYEIANTRYSVAAGDLLMYNSNVVHHEFLKAKNHSILCVAATNIYQPNLEPNCILAPGVPPIIHLTESRKTVQALMEALWDSANSALPHANITCHSLFLSLINLSLDIISQTNKKSASEPLSHSTLGHKIRTYIDTQPIATLTVSSVAQEFQISETYCTRVFRQSFGCSLVNYLIQRKIGEAQTLLLTTDLSIKEIGQRVGYHNQSYFSKVFYQVVGVTPLRYQKMYRHVTKK